MDQALIRLALTLSVISLSVIVGMIVRARDGRVHQLDAAPQDELPADLAALGLDRTTAGTHAVLFGSATCSPCDNVKQLLDELAADDDSFRWSYVDAAERLDLADAHSIRRVPTLLVFDESGSVRARTSGVPSRDELRSALPTAA